MGHLPPASWFQANGYGSLVGSVYYLGKTWEDLRQDLGDFHSSQFVESRNGLRWRSHPEASLSNFLHARGIPHRRGQRYPDEYALVTGRSYGMYDLHFDGLAGEVDVEIWGDKPKGHGEADYAEKRRGRTPGWGRCPSGSWRAASAMAAPRAVNPVGTGPCGVGPS